VERFGLHSPIAFCLQAPRSVMAPGSMSRLFVRCFFLLFFANRDCVLQYPFNFVLNILVRICFFYGLYVIVHCVFIFLSIIRILLSSVYPLARLLFPFTFCSSVLCTLLFSTLDMILCVRLTSWRVCMFFYLLSRAFATNKAVL